MTAHWHCKRDADDIAWLHFDTPDSTVNTLSKDSLDELDLHIATLASDPPRGLVLLSDKATGFCAGADVRGFTEIKNTEQAERHIGMAHTLFQRIEDLPFPTLALIHGFCLGGGLELSLACRYRIARDDAETRLGFPEVRLGIFPGFGGTVRSIRLLGAAKAMPLMLGGHSLSGKQARRMGLVDLAVPERQMRASARHLLLTQATARKAGSAWMNHTPIRQVVAAYLKHRTRALVNPEHYPAPFALIDHWRRHGASDARLYASEKQQVAHLLQGQTTQNLIRVFFLQERLRELGRDSEVPPARRVHVIGGGTMGGDIAAWCALRGLSVTLQDREPKYLSRAMQRAFELFSKKLREPIQLLAARDRLLADHNGHGIAHADVIIEAIYEDPAAKQSLFAEIETRARADAIIASNTSSIPLAVMAEKMRAPERLVGLHFFNPVAKMQLVEVVFDTCTAEALTEQACAFVRQIGRLPLPVRSSPGFLVNRVLMPYLLEALTLIEEGVPAITIDKAATEFGMPMGPVELADTVGLDICLSVAEKLSGEPKREIPATLRRLVEEGHLGRKSGQGFYTWTKGKPVKPRAGHSKAPEVAERMIYRLLNEAVACVREGIVADADMVDAGIIFGTGFAPFRGGPLHYIKNGSRNGMKRSLDELERTYGAPFGPGSGSTHPGQV